MTHEIKLNNHKKVEENDKSIAFKTSTNDDEDEESENEDLDLITKKFMKSTKFEKIKERKKISFKRRIFKFQKRIRKS